MIHHSHQGYHSSPLRHHSRSRLPHFRDAPCALSPEIIGATCLVRGPHDQRFVISELLMVREPSNCASLSQHIFQLGD